MNTNIYMYIDLALHIISWNECQSKKIGYNFLAAGTITFCNTGHYSVEGLRVSCVAVFLLGQTFPRYPSVTYQLYPGTWISPPRQFYMTLWTSVTGQYRTGFETQRYPRLWLHHHCAGHICYRRGISSPSASAWLVPVDAERAFQMNPGREGCSRG